MIWTYPIQTSNGKNKIQIYGEEVNRKGHSKK